MDTRIAQIGIFVEDSNATEEMNKLLSAYGEYIVGRMGIPYRKRNVNVVTIIMDAPQDIISALSGKLGMIKGINSKTLYAKV
ncbi:MULTISPECIES: TM1266 family iron-only hydrogenase system putative regulator [Breznakia]|uniref:Putative iron-only hydrogenase system regulator n=1 Tax=Breznakia blatticola TaxID=1754012 RepID=A0A4R8A6N0_9FIRM|nr:MULTISPECIES: TM1266 family iron-only hydrogenase system putative regulator [Breznakia]MDH6366085.1 putative iron-only hydrogenase system regulator [Breznakia sp. PH1-1]MDH6402983.1 putative iron-only hydrogenase system regulator [Breznakia sp. PF1-11]MDH6410692.1 putative iron-only hydrogenase system regulator [Breznakia sp. PFB1-11]MDH6413251.1 putative iron-only hydrogenase system regulator [Breznakia sp. PFB1-14]MDH6415619.1 putative iron-only hydrogenase system regulator [Breznakia sp.